MRWILGRIGRLLMVLLLVSAVTFGLVNALGGDPSVAILGQGHPPEAYVQLSEELGYHRPVVERYLDWLGNILHGDFGSSVIPPGGEVTQLIGKALPVSVQLVLMGFAISLAVVLPAAMLSARRPGGVVDRAISSMTFVLLSTPSFLSGMVFILFFVKSLGWFPRADWVRFTSDAGVTTNLKHALLPALTVAASALPILLRVLRADLITTLQEDFIVAARARGLGERRILWLEALRPSSISMVTLSGISLGYLLGSTVIVERLFNLPGMGTLIVQAVNNRDILLIQGAVLIVAAIYVTINTLVDMSYQLLDPRIRRGGG